MAKNLFYGIQFPERAGILFLATLFRPKFDSVNWIIGTFLLGIKRRENQLISALYVVGELLLCGATPPLCTWYLLEE
jgi:hypothetical protein